jgi:hypothetical protein
MKAPIPTEDVVATRELSIVGSEDKVTVVLGRPRQVDEREAVCPYRITYLDHTIGRDAHGADLFQALLLALEAVTWELQHNGHLPSDKMYLYEPGDDMGFLEKIPLP